MKKTILEFVYNPTYNAGKRIGILLTGTVGCGKTSLMKLFKHIAPHLISYDVIPWRDTVFQFNKKGFSVIEKYGNTNSYCFDDIGIETKRKHF